MRVSDVTHAGVITNVFPWRQRVTARINGTSFVSSHPRGVIHVSVVVLTYFPPVVGSISDDLKNKAETHQARVTILV